MSEFPSIIIRKEGERVGGGVTEEFNRSDHSDFATSKELKDREFSGVRHNSIISRHEIWVLGEMRATMDDGIVTTFPEKWEELYADVFGLVDVKVSK